MKICLTIPFNHHSETASFALPYGLAVIAAIVKKNHPNSELYYSTHESDILNADIIYCSGLSESWGLINELGKKATDLGKRFIVGGQHATALPHTLRYGEVFQGPLENFDKIWTNPLPDWSIFSAEQAKKARYAVMTSRGCPFKCRFCSSSSFWGGYMPMPTNRVIAEIRQLADMGVEEIILFDDLFTANIKRLRALVEKITQEGLNKIKYSCLVRADSISTEVLDLLREMNVVNTAFGAESGSDIILRVMNKKTTRQQNQHCIDSLLAYGYTPVFSLIVGFPGETASTLLETFNFITENRAQCLPEVYPVQPLPGTWLWEYFMSHHAPDLETFNWSSLGLRGNKVDWDTYHLLSNSCTLDDLRDFFSNLSTIL